MGEELWGKKLDQQLILRGDPTARIVLDGDALVAVCWLPCTELTLRWGVSPGADHSTGGRGRRAREVRRAGDVRATDGRRAGDGRGGG